MPECLLPSFNKQPQAEQKHQWEHRRQPIISLCMRRGRVCFHQWLAKRIQWMVQEIRNIQMKQCSCAQSSKKTLLGRTVSLLRNEGWRQHPKNKQQAGIDRYLCALFYPVCSVLVSCLWYPFLQNRFCLNFLSTVWFFLHHNSSPSSRFLLFRTRTQYDWCVPQTSELSC